MLKLCGGVSRIKTNIKTVNEFRPEKLVYEREYKRVLKIIKVVLNNEFTC